MNVSEDDKFIQAIHRIDKRVERIERVLLGDEEAEQDGLVHKVKIIQTTLRMTRSLGIKLLEA